VNLNTPLPPYKAKGSGDPRQGARVYGTFCASCHGQIGQKPGKAGSIINRSFLQLIDDQSLRTLVIIGRPEFNAPDWRHDVPGHPMSEQDITDVVAWLSSQRPQASGAATRQGGQ
jgi:mono/diheme cytochrome c family protein